MRPIGSLRRIGYLPVHQVLTRAHRRRRAGSVPIETFDELLAEHAQNRDTVFVHVGLRDIRSAFDTNPYRFLIDRLKSEFESVITPGFTDYFKTSGVYHVNYSRPATGTFNRLFLEDADYRTLDAVKSFLVRGPYRFDGCVHDDTYHPEGCFARLIEDNVLVLNVGVPWVTCSIMHYLEAYHAVPYMEQRTFDGILYRDETRSTPITQRTGVYTSEYYSWNKRKIQRRLLDADLLSASRLNGLWIGVFDLQPVMDNLSRAIARDPLYLVTL